MVRRAPRSVAALVATSILTWAPAMQAQARGAASSAEPAEPEAKPSAEDPGEPEPSAGGDDPSDAGNGTAASLPERAAQPVEIGPPPQPPEPEPAPPPVVEPLPVDPNRPEEPRFGGRPATGKGLLIAGASTFAVGAAALVTSSLITLNCSHDGPLACKYEDQAEFLIPLSATPAVLGVILMGIGAGYYARYKRWERWTPDSDRAQAVLVPTANRDGAGLAVNARF